MNIPFHALQLVKADAKVTLKSTSLSTNDDLSSGEVLLKVAYSGINYKDAIATLPNGKIIQNYPIIPGIDIAGEVVHSKDDRYKEGDKVIATGYEIGVAHDGGYSQYAQIPANWLIPLPPTLSLKEAMTFGTAGFTAALSIYQLEKNGLTPEKGKVLVTGATGGVGSMAVAMLAKLHYEVVASTGKSTEASYLQHLGASEIISRSEVYDGRLKPLHKPTWQGAVDPVGGMQLASILSKLHYGGAVAVSGLTGGTELSTTVFPFILRGVNLLGIDSVYTPMDIRREVWQRMATTWKPKQLSSMIQEEITLEQVPSKIPFLLEGKVRGRYIVAL